MDSYLAWHLNTSSRRLSLSKSESPASHPSVTRLFQCGAIKSPASRRKIRVLREAVLARGDWPLLCDKLAISSAYLRAKNRNDLRPITLSKVSLPEVGFSDVAILGGGWLQSPASDGPPCHERFDMASPNFTPRYIFTECRTLWIRSPRQNVGHILKLPQVCHFFKNKASTKGSRCRECSWLSGYIQVSVTLPTK